MSAARGDIWLVDFCDPVGPRAGGASTGVVLSADLLSASPAGVVIVVPCTTRRRGLASHVELDPMSSGLDEVTCAKCEEVKSIPERRLVARLGSVGPSGMFEIGRVVRFLLDL